MTVFAFWFDSNKELNYPFLDTRVKRGSNDFTTRVNSYIGTTIVVPDKHTFKIYDSVFLRVYLKYTPVTYTTAHSIKIPCTIYISIPQNSFMSSHTRTRTHLRYTCVGAYIYMHRSLGRSATLLLWNAAGRQRLAIYMYVCWE